MSIPRPDLITVLLDALRGTTIPAVPLADRILELEQEDPRIARIEALEVTDTLDGYRDAAESIRAILRGES